MSLRSSENTALPPAGATLKYESVLPFGEVEVDRSPSCLTVRVGTPGRRDTATALAVLAAFHAAAVTAVALLAANELWSEWRLAASLYPPNPWVVFRQLASPWNSVIAIALLVNFVATGVWPTLRTMRRAGRPTILVGSPEGLAYENAPGGRRGRLPRAELREFRIARFRLGRLSKRRRLLATVAGRRRAVMLADGLTPEAATAVCDALAAAVALPGEVPRP